MKEENFYNLAEALDLDFDGDEHIMRRISLGLPLMRKPTDKPVQQDFTTRLEETQDAILASEIDQDIRDLNLD